MTTIKLVMDGDQSVPEMAGKEVIELQTMTITALSGGMQSGQPSMAFIFALPDGRMVFAETSFKLFMAAADAFRARFRN